MKILFEGINSKNSVKIAGHFWQQEADLQDQKYATLNSIIMKPEI